MNHGIYVPCGHCDACLMDKADSRAARIRATGSKDSICYFITLTYSNLFIPYFRKSDIDIYSWNSNQLIPVYRDFDMRYERVSKDYKCQVKRKYLSKPLKQVLVTPSILVDLKNDRFKPLRGQYDPDKVGVCYFSDVQNFIKRLKINLHRIYKYDTSQNIFKFYQCAEYGPTTARPHFHLLIYVHRDKLSISSFKNAVVKSWSYAHRSRTRQYIEIAEDAASYVSTYVNRDSDICSSLQENFPEKHSYSHGFGTDIFPRSVAEISEKIYRGDLRYTKSVVTSGQLLSVSCVYPKYYLNRFFPKFKGYSRFTSDEIQYIVEKPFTLISDRFSEQTKDFTDEDFHRVVVSLTNACKNSGLHSSVYSDLYVRAWRVRASNVLRDWYARAIYYKDFAQMYDNIHEFYGGFIDSPTLDRLFDVVTDFKGDINEFASTVTRTNEQKSKYNKKIKQKKLIYNLA